MISPLITRKQLEIINRKTLRYPLQIAEKDYILAVVLKIISESPLGRSFVFKGGTAINHCYLEQYRFSEDLDFSLKKNSITITDIRNVFSNFPFLSIKKDYVSKATIKIEKLQYIGPLLSPNSLKFDIDILQNVLLPPQPLKYNNVWGMDFVTNVMDINEICAEKIRAMSDRARYRDFYDLFWLTKTYRLNINEIVSFISKKEVRKPITKTNILRNWEIVGTQKVKEMDKIYYSKDVDDKLIKNLIHSISFTEIKSIINK